MIVKPKKYRKKPLVIEAVQFLLSNAADVNQWCSGHQISYENGETKIEIATLGGTMTAVPGDYVIKGVHGEFYPVQREIFEAYYDAHEEF